MRLFNLNTAPEIRSKTVRTLVKKGYSKSILKAVENERSDKNSNTGKFKGITVTRVGHRK